MDILTRVNPASASVRALPRLLTPACDWRQTYAPAAPRTGTLLTTAHLSRGPQIAGICSAAVDAMTVIGDMTDATFSTRLGLSASPPV